MFVKELCQKQRFYTHFLYNDFILSYFSLRLRLDSNSFVSDCPVGWNVVGDSCYIYLDGSQSYAAAQSTCKSFHSDATLPIFMNEEEGNYFIA